MASRCGRCKPGRLWSRALCVVICAALPWSASADALWLPLRNHNPFLQIYGMPLYQARPLAAGETRYLASFDVANFADSGMVGAESVELDGESYFLTLSARRGINDWLELGLDLPLLAHTPGSLDGLIKNFHDLIGVSNERRSGPENELQLAYAYPGGAFDLSSSSQGIGDLQLTAAVPLIRNDPARGLALRATLKLPTGDANELLGSGGYDISLALYFDQAVTLVGQSFDVAAFGGALWLGDSDYFADMQRSTVGFGGIGAAWHATERFSVNGQLVVQDSYLDSAVPEVGERTVQGALGALFRFPRSRTAISLMIFEDINGNATADVAVQVAIRNY